MKVRANNDIYENGVSIFLKNEIYEVVFEYDTVYELQRAPGIRRCYPKLFFTVVLEEGVE